jgi:PAS domain S-box-containing protein
MYGLSSDTTGNGGMPPWDVGEASTRRQGSTTVCVRMWKTVYSVLWSQTSTDVRQASFKVPFEANTSTILMSGVAERRLLSFIESVPDAMMLSDAEGKIALVNTNTEKLFGYRRDSVPGKKVEIIPPRFRARHLRQRARNYLNPAIRPMGLGRDVLARCKGGGEFRLEINLSPIQIGGALFVRSAIRDVSVRKALLSWTERATE